MHWICWVRGTESAEKGRRSGLHSSCWSFCCFSSDAGPRLPLLLLDNLGAYVTGTELGHTATLKRGTCSCGAPAAEAACHESMVQDCAELCRTVLDCAGLCRLCWTVLDCAGLCRTESWVWMSAAVCCLLPLLMLHCMLTPHGSA